jgi:TIR domain
MARVFVSHRGCDLQTATTIAQTLSARGHTVWLDQWEIGVGDSIVQRMNQGLEGSAYLILCYSTEGVLTPWISREWMSALARQMTGANVKVLPVLVSGGNGPAILADIKYANLGANWQRGIEELLRAIQ